MQAESILEHKTRLLRTLIVVVSIAVSAMAFMRYTNHENTQALIDIVFVVILGLCYFMLTNSNYFFMIARVVLFFSILIGFVLVLTIENSLSKFIWFPTIIYLMFYLLDRKEGLYWAMLVISMLLGIFMYNPELIGLNRLEFFSWLLNMFIILLIVNWYESIKEMSVNRMLEAQYALENQVQEKTLELQNLNDTLKSKVKQEIEKNRYQEQMMIQQTRMAQMGEMISMIAHQWRQPLTAISATSATIEIKAQLNNLDNITAQQKAREISTFSQHLSSTIDDFRNFFKTNKEKTNTNYNELIQSVLNIIGASISNRKITLTKELNSHSNFNTYANELKQVLLNLIKNAEDALIEKNIDNGYIKLYTHEDEYNCILEVHDNAGGIPDHIRNKIFEPYFSTKTKKDGTGLGLYMSKTIIEEHCFGKLSVHNDENGAIFIISLPKF